MPEVWALLKSIQTLLWSIALGVLPLVDLIVDVSVQNGSGNVSMMDMPAHWCEIFDNKKENIEGYDWRERFVAVNTVLLDKTLCTRMRFFAINMFLFFQLSLQYHLAWDDVLAGTNMVLIQVLFLSMEFAFTIWVSFYWLFSMLLMDPSYITRYSTAIITVFSKRTEEFLALPSRVGRGWGSPISTTLSSSLTWHSSW